MNKTNRNRVAFAATSLAATLAAAAPAMEDAPRPEDSRARLGVLADLRTDPPAQGTRAVVQSLIEIQKDGLTVVDTGTPLRRSATPNRQAPAARNAQATAGTADPNGAATEAQPLVPRPNAQARRPAAGSALAAAQDPDDDGDETLRMQAIALVQPLLRTDLLPTATATTVDIDVNLPTTQRSGAEIPHLRNAAAQEEALDSPLLRWSPQRFFRWVTQNREWVIAGSVLLLTLLTVGNLMASRRR